MRPHLTHTATLSGLTFVVHWAWESIQCPLFYVHGSYDTAWWGMVTAAAGDVVLTWLIYATVAACAGSWRWSRKTLGRAELGIMTMMAVVLAVGIELRGLTTGSWTYSAAMPTAPILSVGLVPIMQLALLTPILVLASERLLRAQRV